MKVSVTTHAIQRWRERVAVRADEKADSLLDRFQVAVKLQGEPPRGLAHYKDGNVMFVVSTDEWKSTIITVIDETPKPVNTITQDYCEKEDELIYAALPDIMTKRSWLQEEIKTLVGCKSDYCKARRRWIETKFRETKEEWKNINFIRHCATECERRQKEKDNEWEQWYFEQFSKPEN